MQQVDEVRRKREEKWARLIKERCPYLSDEQCARLARVYDPHADFPWVNLERSGR